MSLILIVVCALVIRFDVSDRDCTLLLWGNLIGSCLLLGIGIMGFGLCGLAGWSRFGWRSRLIRSRLCCGNVLMLITGWRMIISGSSNHLLKLCLVSSRQSFSLLYSHYSNSDEHSIWNPKLVSGSPLLLSLPWQALPTRIHTEHYYFPIFPT